MARMTQNEAKSMKNNSKNQLLPSAGEQQWVMAINIDVFTGRVGRKREERGGGGRKKEAGIAEKRKQRKTYENTNIIRISLFGIII